MSSTPLIWLMWLCWAGPDSVHSVSLSRGENLRPLDRHNLLNRQIKPAAVKLGLSKSIDFRSFRTMHSSLMLRSGVRAEVVRDNMGHSDIDQTQNIYGKSWWDERTDAVTGAVSVVFGEPKPKKKKPESLKACRLSSAAPNGNPIGNPVPRRKT